mgnify:CR=1 FL=1
MGIVLHDIGVLKLERRLAVASIRKVIILFPTFKFIVGFFPSKSLLFNDDNIRLLHENILKDCVKSVLLNILVIFLCFLSLKKTD